MAPWWTVAKFALYSRLFIILLQFASNTLIPDHDAGVFNPPLSSSENFTVIDQVIFSVLGGFHRWDAVYFLHIAEHGYTYENCVAFFPLYPLMIATLKNAALNICPFATDTSLLLLIGVTANVALFVVAAVLLLYLGLAVTQDDRLSLYAAVLFCVNPASIFMTAPYTETLFACLSFGAMLYIKQQRLFTAALLIGASGLTRSNGLVSVGFFLHYYAMDLISRLKIAYYTRSSRMKFFESVVAETTSQAILVMYCVILSVVPFFGYQSYVYELFCFPDIQQEEAETLMDPAVVTYGRERGYKLLGDTPVSPWCFEPLALSYSYIQSHHWGVGFMKYFELKQIPNFILAAPIVTLSLCACYSFYEENPAACQTLGLVKVKKVKVETVGRQDAKRRCSNTGWDHTDLVVYVLHLLFLTTFGCFFMHIQVLTRFLCSASPLVYWYASYLVLDGKHFTDHDDDDNDKSVLRESPWALLNVKAYKTTAAKCVIAYFVGYSVLGTLAFSNFLPWT